MQYIVKTESNKYYQNLTNNLKHLLFPPIFIGNFQISETSNNGKFPLTLSLLSHLNVRLILHNLNPLSFKRSRTHEEAEDIR